MIDWTTVAVAAVSGGAPLLVLVLQNRHNRAQREESLAVARTDRQRQALQEIMIEAERIQRVASEASIATLARVTGGEAPGPVVPVETARLRGLVLINFPACLADLEAHDAECAAAVERLRAELRHDTVMPATVVFTHSLALATTNLRNNLQARLQQEAEAIR